MAQFDNTYPSFASDRIKLIHDLEQNDAAGLEWLRKASPVEMMMIWDFICRDFKSHRLDIMSRLAAIGMRHLVLKAVDDTEPKKEPTP